MSKTLKRITAITEEVNISQLGCSGDKVYYLKMDEDAMDKLPRTLRSIESIYSLKLNSNKKPELLIRDAKYFVVNDQFMLLRNPRGFELIRLKDRKKMLIKKMEELSKEWYKYYFIISPFNDKLLIYDKNENSISVININED